ncbi:MAG: SDR family oxidoreductase [Acinetobacter sp.]
MNQALQRKRVLVTGGSRGIGAAIVKRLAQEGADVAFTYHSREEDAEKTAKLVEAAGRKAVAIRADSADPQAVIGAVQHTVQELGGIDILINNAGIGTFAPVDSVSLSELDRIWAINVRAVFLASQEAIKHMPSGGRIINISSCNAERMPFAGGSIYAMSKSALTGLVKGLSRDLGPRGITINNIQPGPVATEMNPEDGEFSDLMKSATAVSRYSMPEEIAAFAAYLAGPETGFITGASLTIDGGLSA